MPYKSKEVLRVLKHLGFTEHHQVGSHLTLKHPDGRRTILPMHQATLKKGTFMSILKDAGLTLNTFRKQL